MQCTPYVDCSLTRRVLSNAVASWSPSSSPRLGRQSKRFGETGVPDSAAAWTLVNLRGKVADQRLGQHRQHPVQDVL